MISTVAEFDRGEKPAKAGAKSMYPYSTLLHTQIVTQSSRLEAKFETDRAIMVSAPGTMQPHDAFCVVAKAQKGKQGAPNWERAAQRLRLDGHRWGRMVEKVIGVSNQQTEKSWGNLRGSTFKGAGDDEPPV